MRYENDCKRTEDIMVSLLKIPAIKDILYEQLVQLIAKAILMDDEFRTMFEEMLNNLETPEDLKELIDVLARKFGDIDLTDKDLVKERYEQGAIIMKRYFENDEES